MNRENQEGKNWNEYYNSSIVTRNDVKKIGIRELVSKNLTTNHPSDLNIWVSEHFLETLEQGGAKCHVNVNSASCMPNLFLDSFKGRLNLSFKSEKASFIMERCQNFNMEALLYDNAFVKIGKGCSANSCSATVVDSELIMGFDCMLSHGVIFQPSDQHDIVEQRTGGLVNTKRSIILGNHVWIGKEAYIGAGALIHDDSVIGARSVVVGEVAANCIYAGNPAKKVKESITWKRSFSRISDW